MPVIEVMKNHHLIKLRQDQHPLYLVIGNFQYFFLRFLICFHNSWFIREFSRLGKVGGYLLSVPLSKMFPYVCILHKSPL